MRMRGEGEGTKESDIAITEQQDSLTYFDHLLEFLHVPSHKVQEGETVKVLCSLVSHFYNLKKYTITFITWGNF